MTDFSIYKTTTDSYRDRGVHVSRVRPADPDQRNKVPLIFVHGGLHGSWCWEKYLPFFAQRGWDCHALDWFGHHLSDAISDEQLVRRSCGDVAEEIGVAASGLNCPPLLIGHSMGALACQKYAEEREVAGLVLITPVLPAAIEAPAIPLEVDLSMPWGPPPFEIAVDLFFRGMPEHDARRYFDLLVPESPLAVAEATGGAAVEVDRVKISGPVLAIAGEFDQLTPAAGVRKLAEYYGADYRFHFGRGHGMLLDERWEETAAQIARWITQQILSRGD